MKIIKVSVGKPQDHDWQGQRVRTSIFKSEIKGAVSVKFLNLEGDGQADLRYHGGPFKAVYAYSAHDYAWWKQRHPEHSYEFGKFGENLTIDELDENKVFVGDQFRIGSVLVEASEPRFPCFKLGLRFGDPSIVKKFFEANRWGIYFRVLEEGQLSCGDVVEKIFESATEVPVRELFYLASGKSEDPDKVQRLLAFKGLDPAYRAKLESLD